MDRMRSSDGNSRSLGGQGLEAHVTVSQTGPVLDTRYIDADKSRHNAAATLPPPLAHPCPGACAHPRPHPHPSPPYEQVGEGEGQPQQAAAGGQGAERGTGQGAQGGGAAGVPQVVVGGDDCGCGLSWGVG